MDKLTYREATEADAVFVARHMRAADVAEVRAAGRDPECAMIEGLRVSDIAVTVVSPAGNPMVIYGIAPGCRLTGLGRPWLLGTDEAMQFKRNFIVDGRNVIIKMLSLYYKLENYVHVDNRVSVRWLKMLGFKMDDPFKFGVNGEMFMRFHLTRDEHNV